MWVSTGSGKSLKPTKNSAVRDHMFVFEDNIGPFEDFFTSANGSKDFRIKLHECSNSYRCAPVKGYLCYKTIFCYKIAFDV